MKPNVNKEKVTAIKTQILYVLAHYPKARNSDIYLMEILWSVFYPQHVDNDKVCLSSLSVLPQMDDVSRLRRQVQHDDKLFPPTDWEVAKARRWNEDEWKKALGYLKKDESGQLSFV